MGGFGPSTRLLIRHEGLRLKPYKCSAGKTSIGVGRNLEDNGITEEEAVMLLTNDLQWVEEALNKHVGWWVALDEVRRAVLVNMVFNLGWPRFSAFRKMIAALEQKAYTRAGAEMLDSRWAHQVPERALELAEMMRSGQWPEDM